MKKNKLVIFALNCVNALKEMIAPNDKQKSLSLFKEIGIFILGSILFALYIINYHSSNPIMDILSIQLFVVVLSCIWFLKNIICIILNITKNINTQKFSEILNQEIKCMDENCCIPGKVSYYRYLLFLGAFLILLLLIFNILVFAYGYYQYYFMQFILLLGAFSAYVHANKRLYEISKLLNKNSKENNLTNEEIKDTLDTKNFFRNIFAYTSFSGFVLSFVMLLFSLLFYFVAPATLQVLFFMIFSCATFLILFTSAISTKISIVNYR